MREHNQGVLIRTEPGYKTRPRADPLPQTAEDRDYSFLITDD